MVPNRSSCSSSSSTAVFMPKISTSAGRTPFLERYIACVLVYRCFTSALASWKSHGQTMIKSPSRTHCRRRIFPGIRAILVSPSAQRTVTRRPPRICSASANISLTRRFGILTRIFPPEEPSGDSRRASSSSSTFSSRRRPMWLHLSCRTVDPS